MKSKSSVYITIGLIVGILIFANLIADQFSLRMDLTENNQYTLSKATKDILENLDEPVTVKAYFSEELPPNVAKGKRDFKDLLIEYANLSGGMLVYEFINPSEDKEAEQAAMQNGIRPVMINMREKDQMKQQKAFLGALIQKGEQKEVIPFIEPGAPMEYALSSSIKKITVMDKPQVGLVQGHGEATLQNLQQANNSLSVLYNLRPYNMTDTGSIPMDYKTLAIIGPTDTISPYQVSQLDQYLQNGGNVFLAMNRVEGDLQNASGSSVSTGLEQWLSQKGIQVKNQFVTDANCAAVSVQQQQGFFQFQNQVRFPYLPIINNFTDHPIGKGLEQVILQFASPVEYTGDTSIAFKPIAKTSKQSGTVSPPVRFDISKQWTKNDFPMSNITVAAALSGDFGGNGKVSKLVVITDGDFPQGSRRQQVQEDNVNLLVNSIDWLSDDTGLIDLRTKGVTSRPLDQLEDGTRAILKYVNFLLPILLVVIYGIVRMQVKRSTKLKRMQERYV